MKTIFGSITMHAVVGPTNRTARLRKIEQISGGRFNPIAVRAAAQIHRFAISRATMARFRAENGEAMSDFLTTFLGQVRFGRQEHSIRREKDGK